MTLTDSSPAGSTAGGLGRVRARRVVGLTGGLVVIVGLAGLAGGNEDAPNRDRAVTRLLVKTSAPITCTAHQFSDPPRIVLEFGTPSVLSGLPRHVDVGRGLIRELHSEFYPEAVGRGRRVLRRLTLLLEHEAPFHLVRAGTGLAVEILHPPDIAGPWPSGEVVVGQTEPAAMGRDAARLHALSAALIRDQIALGGGDAAGIGVARRWEGVPVWTPVLEGARRGTGSPAQAHAVWARWSAYGAGVGLAFALGYVWKLRDWRRERTVRQALEKRVWGRGGQDLAALEQLDDAVVATLIVRALEARGYREAGIKEGPAGLALVGLTRGTARALLCWCGTRTLHRAHAEAVQAAVKQDGAQEGIVATLGLLTQRAERVLAAGNVQVLRGHALVELLQEMLQGPREAAAPLQQEPAPATPSPQVAAGERAARDADRRWQEELEVVRRERDDANACVGEEKVRRRELIMELARIQEAYKDQGIVVERLRVELERSRRQHAEPRRDAAAAAGPADRSAPRPARPWPTPLGTIQTGPPSAMIERRVWRRLTLTEPEASEEAAVSVERLEHGGLGSDALVRNIGGGGLLVELTRDLELPTPSQLHVRVCDVVVPVEARVVWRRRGPQGVHLGLEFSAIAPADRERIVQFVESQAAA